MAIHSPRFVVLSAGLKSRRAFSLTEVIVALVLFGLLSALGYLCLRQVVGVQRRSAGRDEALRNLLRAAETLQRDLSNSAHQAQRWAVEPALLGTGSARSSDALALLVSPQNQDGLELSSDSKAEYSQIASYYLAVEPGRSASYVADAEGYEEQCPWKWLIRKQSDAPAAIFPDTLSAIPAGWLAGQLEQPTILWKEPQRRVVAQNLLQFRVLQGPPMWEIRLTAVSLDEASRELALGQVPLSQHRTCLTYRVSVLAHN